jgi:hypothetical protein
MNRRWQPNYLIGHVDPLVPVTTQEHIVVMHTTCVIYALLAGKYAPKQQ